MEVILTVDVEDWYQTNGLNFHHKTWDRYEDRIEESTYKLLDLFDEYGAKGTFFVLGYVAELHPELVLEIFNRGHEIGCHSHYHRIIHGMERKEVLEDIQHSKNVLEEIIGKKVKYFRAPSWSISKKELWLLHELKRMGFVCDSSIQPFKTPLSGIFNAPLEPFIPIVQGVNTEIIEVPSSVAILGPFRIPFSGGFYMRVLPYEIMNWFLKKRIENHFKTMVYCHPWEYDEGFPKIARGPIKKVLQYYNINHNTMKLRKLLKDYQGITLGEAIRNSSFDAIRIP